MKRTVAIIALMALVLAGVAAGASRTDYWQLKGRMMGPMMMGNYDKATEITIKGTVEKIEKPGINRMRGMGGIHLLVKTENETYTVHLGPADFVEKTMTFKEGDAIEVTGSKMTMMGEAAVMAREVKKGDTVLKLRDESGMPLWPMHMNGRHS